MRIIFFSHPNFLNHQSMLRFVKMLETGMRERGHEVEVWFPKARFFRFPVPFSIKKWLGYIDQFIVFPSEVRRRINSCPYDTLFVFTDQALGPWVPLVNNRPHLIHCHDFLSQHSAMGEISENLTSWSGRRYQYLIRKGFTRGKHFISVSGRTKEHLHEFLADAPVLSEIVYNPLNTMYQPYDATEARHKLGSMTGLELSAGYLLHVGGNQWYKNREGVIEIYNAWRSADRCKLPLLLIGEPPSRKIVKAYSQSPFKTDMHFLSGISDQVVRLAYAGASVFLFPSLAEGFGWPIAEAMACGCPVITTDEAPMTEVAGNAGFFISRRPSKGREVEAWASAGASVVNEVLLLDYSERQAVIQAGLANVKRFNADSTLDRVETIYKNILAEREKADCRQRKLLLRIE